MNEQHLTLIDAAASGDRLALEAIAAMKPQAMAKLNNDVYFAGVDRQERQGEQLGADRFE